MRSASEFFLGLGLFASRMKIGGYCGVHIEYDDVKCHFVIELTSEHMCQMRDDALACIGYPDDEWYSDNSVKMKYNVL
ncbi:MAG: hypothetical protein HUJ99_01690 [Bacteroidaceae bacterium]|nr:hypothetical protein [Bacteroidaceae bacterium]